MRIRDKETNEVYETGKTYISVLIKNETKDKWHTMDFASIKELTDTLEDYEEPKGIQDVCNVKSCVFVWMGSEEEAEKAVEKLKALKRLKDNGFKFTGWEDLNTLDPEDSLLVNRDVVDGECVSGFRMVDYSDCIKDLDLLFGGEE